MNNKQILFLLLFSLAAVWSGFAQQKVSILGDSYSTFGGYMTPETNLCWYNGPDGGKKDNDVKTVEQTWWHQLIQEHGLQLEINNSYSGSTVCHTGYRKEDYSDRSFITRIHRLGTPDILLVFGGTNDSWAKSPVGEFQYGGWSKQDLYSFRPAFSYLMHSLRELYPATLIINLTNSELSPEVTESMEAICRYYGITNIRLKDVEKQHGHPSIKGMKSIAGQVWEVIRQEQQ
ncbi:MAG: hypothetical protein IJ511_00225 [Bacteroides sp.]|nr:hypothetical protein [Bacteroides sp.]